jgi:hypothetical protein
MCPQCISPGFLRCIPRFLAAAAILPAPRNIVQLRERSIPNNPITWNATPFFRRVDAGLRKCGHSLRQCSATLQEPPGDGWLACPRPRGHVALP